MRFLGSTVTVRRWGLYLLMYVSLVLLYSSWSLASWLKGPDCLDAAIVERADRSEGLSRWDCPGFDWLLDPLRISCVTSSAFVFLPETTLLKFYRFSTAWPRFWPSLAKTGWFSIDCFLSRSSMKRLSFLAI